MEKLEKNYFEMSAFVQTANTWVSSQKKESKLRYALKKVMKRCTTIMETTQAQLEDIDVDHAQEKDGILVYNGDSLSFSKEELKKRNKERRTLLQTKVIIEPHIVTVPADLTPTLRDAFAGFVLSESEEPLDEEISE